MLSGLLAYKKAYVSLCFQESCKSICSHRQDVDRLHFFTNFTQLIKFRKLLLQDTLKIRDFSHSTSFHSPVLRISVSRLLSLS